MPHRYLRRRAEDGHHPCATVEHARVDGRRPDRQLGRQPGVVPQSRAQVTDQVDVGLGQFPRPSAAHRQPIWAECHHRTLVAGGRVEEGRQHGPGPGLRDVQNVLLQLGGKRIRQWQQQAAAFVDLGRHRDRGQQFAGDGVPHGRAGAQGVVIDVGEVLGTLDQHALSRGDRRSHPVGADDVLGEHGAAHRPEPVQLVHRRRVQRPPLDDAALGVGQQQTHARPRQILGGAGHRRLEHLQEVIVEQILVDAGNVTDVCGSAERALRPQPRFEQVRRHRQVRVGGSEELRAELLEPRSAGPCRHRQLLASRFRDRTPECDLDHKCRPDPGARRP